MRRTTRPTPLPYVVVAAGAGGGAGDDGGRVTEACVYTRVVLAPVSVGGSKLLKSDYARFNRANSIDLLNWSSSAKQKRPSAGSMLVSGGMVIMPRRTFFAPGVVLIERERGCVAAPGTIAHQARSLSREDPSLRPCWEALSASPMHPT